jgi:probable F420-dependent oxidoreductase
VRFEIAMPGRNHIPPENDRVPHAPEWVRRLAAPDFQVIASRIDGLGYHSISTSDHLGMPYFEVPRLGAYWLDALSVMSFLIGATQRVRVGASVLVLPYHHPLILAKAISTMDVLSGGRIDVSIGVGHVVREFEVLNVPFADRGAIADETLEAMLELWSSEKPEHHGRYFQIDGLAFEPKPIQSPRPPIYVGGNSKPALRRAARCDGWQPNPTAFSVDEIPPLLNYIRSVRDGVGEGADFEVRWVGAVPGLGRPDFGALSSAARSSYADQILERLVYLENAEITLLQVPEPVTASMNDFLEFVQWFDEEVIAKSG